MRIRGDDAVQSIMSKRYRKKCLSVRDKHYLWVAWANWCNNSSFFQAQHRVLVSHHALLEIVRNDEASSDAVREDTDYPSLPDTND